MRRHPAKPRLIISWSKYLGTPYLPPCYLINECEHRLFLQPEQEQRLGQAPSRRRGACSASSSDRFPRLYVGLRLRSWFEFFLASRQWRSRTITNPAITLLQR